MATGVPLDGPLINPAWQRRLAAGISYITNGTFLDLHVHDHDLGDTVRLAEPIAVGIRGNEIGRNDFRDIDLIGGSGVFDLLSSVSKKPFQTHVLFFQSLLMLGVVLAKTTAFLPPSIESLFRYPNLLGCG